MAFIFDAVHVTVDTPPVSKISTTILTFFYHQLAVRYSKFGKVLPYKVIRVYSYFSGFKRNLNSLYVESFGLLSISLSKVCFAISVSCKTTNFMNSPSSPTPWVIYTRPNPLENKRFLRLVTQRLFYIASKPACIL